MPFLPRTVKPLNLRNLTAAADALKCTEFSAHIHHEGVVKFTKSAVNHASAEAIRQAGLVALPCFDVRNHAAAEADITPQDPDGGPLDPHTVTFWVTVGLAD